VVRDSDTGATPIEKWENGYGITSAPLYYDGIVYSGITGGEFGVRGRLTALDAKTGAILWRWYTLPGRPFCDVRSMSGLPPKDGV
jgi:outer membrane protein assembly factor BamB